VLRGARAQHGDVSTLRLTTIRPIVVVARAGEVEPLLEADPAAAHAAAPSGADPARAGVRGGGHRGPPRGDGGDRDPPCRCVAADALFARRRAPLVRLLSSEIDARRARPADDDVLGRALGDEPDVATGAIIDELLALLMAAQEPAAAALTWRATACRRASR
jgi:hypothetical protein